MTPSVARRIELEAVAERLGAAGPVGVRGVARISGLLTDGTGPLYRASSPGRLRDELRAALAAMDPFDLSDRGGRRRQTPAIPTTGLLSGSAPAEPWNVASP